MLKAIGYSIKFLLIAVIILVLGQVLEVQGTPISDHIKVALNKAEKGNVLGTVKKTATDMVNVANTAAGLPTLGNGAKEADEKGAKRSPAEENKEDDPKNILSRVKEIKDREKAALKELLKD